MEPRCPATPAPPGRLADRRDAAGYHLTLRLADDRTLPAAPGDLRRIARILLARGAGRGLLAFRVVDTHVHVVLTAPRESVGRFAQAAESALQQALRFGAPFEPARIRPVVDAGHLRNAVRYVLRQETRHGLTRDPRHDGSSLPDVLGLRVLDEALAARASVWLPRVPRAEWLSWAGWSGLEQGEAPLLDLADAAAAAIGEPQLAGRSARCVVARSAAAGIARAAGLRASHVGDLLRLSTRAVRDAWVREAPPALTRAILGQLRLRAFLGERADAPPERVLR